MKKPILFIVALSAVLCACSKEQQTPAPAPLPGAMTITAGTDSNLKTSLNGTSILWQSDSIVVFDNELNGVKFTTTVKDVSTADFTTDSWTGKTPEYAASYCPTYNTRMEFRSPSKGILPVEIRSTQAIGWVNTFSKQAYASVGKMVENSGSYSVNMKNVMGLIEVKFTDASIKKIVATAIGGEQMTGWVTVDYEKLANGDTDFWAPIEGKSKPSTATITMSSAGKYYISIYPQTYAQGIRLQAYNGSNKLVVERTIGATGGVTITRNTITPLAKDIDDLLPSTVVLDVRFHNAENVCPFGTLASKANQTKNGEEYSFAYNYEYNSNNYTKNFTFKLGNTGTIANGYAYSASTIAYMKGAKNFVFNDANGWILTPAIVGKYLHTITVGMSNGVYSDTRYMRIKKVLSESIAQKQPAASTDAGPVATSIHFYTDGNDGVTPSMAAKITEKNTQYYIQFSTNIQIDYLTLTYSDTLPTRN